MEKETNRKKSNYGIIALILMIISIIVLFSTYCIENIIIISIVSFILSILSLVRKEKMYSKIMSIISIIVTSIVIILCIYSYTMPVYDDKPIIYLYPETEQEVSVKVGAEDRLTCTYPKYNNGWNVLAKPNGDLVDIETGRNLYALYWEGKDINAKVEKDGFVVKGEDSIKFLEEKLEMLGLNEREAEEFIVYWLPKLEANKYNYIRFETREEIEKNMPLIINPMPDTVIRIVMNFKGLDKPIEVEEQKLSTPERKGFTVIEWGGTEIK